MNTSSYQRRVGIVALAYVAAVSSTLRIDGNNSADGLRQLKDGKALGKDVLEIRNYQLDKLPHDLGKNAASNGIKWVAMESVSAPEDFLTQAEENTIAPFSSVTHLDLSTSFFGSPKSLSWIKLLFPNILQLQMTLEALPVQTKEDIAVCSGRKLAMESVERITLRGGSGDQVIPPIFENLRFFPNLELIRFLNSGNFPALEDAQGENISLPKVDEIILDCVPSMSQDVLRKLPAVFPNVRDLSINRSAFEKLTSGGPTSTPIKSFEKLKTLWIHCDSDVHIGAKVAEVFPKLSSLSLLFPSNSNSTIHPPPSEENVTQLETLKEISIRGGTKGSEFPLESFEALFPNCTVKHTWKRMDDLIDFWRQQ